MEAFHSENDNDEPTGINMKGKSIDFQDSCIALKHHLKKGKIFKDNEGRQLKILEAPNGPGPIDVEVTTLSNKPSEKRGNAKLILHKPNLKKGATIQASLFAGSSFIFVKTLMHKFVKPFIDSLISEPDENPMDQYEVKPKNKTFGKAKVTFENDSQCILCEKSFPTNHGLSIHIGKVHAEDKVSKGPTEKRKRKGEVTNEEKEEKRRKKLDEEELDDASAECENCGQTFRYKNSYIWHIKNCTQRRKELHAKSVLAPAKPEEINEISTKLITKSCPECDNIVKAKDFVTLIENMRKHNSQCKIVIETKLKDETAPSESEVDKVIEGVKELNVTDKYPGRNFNEIPIVETVKYSHQCSECQFTASDLSQMSDHIQRYHEIKQENKIPERLENLLRIKGININDHRLVRTGGGGKCGFNCVSLHTTGSEALADEIRQNSNEHIVSNWDKYKDSYEFPYTERVGSGRRTFKDKIKFLTFLREEEDASTMWMTHVCLQAVSTMLNLNIKILTTGLSPPSSYRCARCKTPVTFDTEEEMSTHTELVHHRIETEEEKEGRRQKARWTEMKPDTSRRDNSSNEKAEELILLHVNDVHYDLIVHKSHNAFKTESNMKEHTEKHKNFKSWAEATKASLVHTDTKQPSVKVSMDEEEIKAKRLKKIDISDNEWKTVNKRGRGEN